MYILTFKVETNKHLYLTLEDSGIPTMDLGPLPEDGWFNIALDMSNGDGTNHPTKGNKIDLYIDDTLVYSGNGFYGSGSGQEKPNIGAVYQVMVLPVSGATGTIYFDNTVLK